AVHGRNDDDHAVGTADMTDSGLDGLAGSTRHPAELVDVDRRAHATNVFGWLATASSPPIRREKMKQMLLQAQSYRGATLSVAIYLIRRRDAGATVAASATIS